MTVAADQIKGVARALLSAQSDADKDRAEHVFVRRYVEADLTDGGTAATAAGERVVHRAQVSGRILSAYVTTPVTAAANGTNYGTFTLGKRSGGGARTSVGTVDSSASAFTAWTPRAVTITAGSDTYAAGDVITLEVTKAGTGVALGTATAPAHVSVLIEEQT